MRHYNDKDLREVETQVQGLAEHDGGPRFYFKEDASADVDMSPAHAASPKMRKFEQKDVIGGGAYGMVLKCWDDVHRHEVAIKKIDWSTIEREIRRVIREVRILRHLQHPNLIRLVGLYAQETTVGKDSQDNQSSSNSYARPYAVAPYNLFIVTELMDSPLSQLIHEHSKTWHESRHTKGQYKIEHVIWLVHQMLHGLHGLHSARIVHRDIKPHNMLVNLSDTTLRICDFGLSRASQPSNNVSHYVVTRYYRAPEIVYGSSTLDPCIDIWAAGCVAAELLIGEPLFAIDSTTVDGKFHGGNASKALLRLLNRLGKPCPEDIRAVPHDNVRQYLSKVTATHLQKSSIDRDLVPFIRKNLRLPMADDVHDKLEQTLALIDDMMQFNPAKRPTALALLNYDVFSRFMRPDCVFSCPVFDQPDPTEADDFAASGPKLLLDECQIPVDYPSWEGDDDSELMPDETEEIIDFLKLTASGQSPTRDVWEALLTDDVSRQALAQALTQLGIEPELSVLLQLSADDLLNVARLVATIMQNTAMDFLNNLPPEASSLVPAPVTLANVADMQACIYARLQCMPNLDPQVAEDIRGNIDFLHESVSVMYNMTAFNQGQQPPAPAAQPSAATMAAVPKPPPAQVTGEIDWAAVDTDDDSEGGSFIDIDK